VTSAVRNVTFDCRDAGSVARFWERVTGYAIAFEDQPGNPFWVLTPKEPNLPRLVFVTVPETKSIKNRVHLDLVPNDGTQETEVSRLLTLGASIVDDRRSSEPGGWVVMADPEGNEFCVEHA
jgi:predicted enzyme related to lactoylglutathione lyase